ncbi:MAG: hypothetical protein IJR45_02855, partial [Firmicutes bacterium]|nr:hypothetical protein [Bacillota bacterium]
LAIYLPMFLIGISTLFFNGLTSGKNSYRAMQAAGSAMGLLIGGAFFAVFFGVIVGWFITSFIFMARLASFASQRIPMAKYLGCQKEFEKFMKQFSPEFSYEFFAGKTVSLIKNLIYSDTPTELPFYNGPELDPRFKNIVDVTSMGAVGITKTETVGDYVLISADVYLENTYFTNGKIYRKNEMFKTVMKKNVSAPVDMRFKITSIHCPSCGASFDATKNRICPYCSSAYKMEDMDWSIEELVK